MLARGVVVAALLLAGCGGGSSAGPVAPAAPVALATAGGTLSPRGPVIDDVPVERVVDGDTIKVLVDGRTVTVRLIGINTPETVKPSAPVECFGPEASDFAKSTLDGTRVTLELDPSQGEKDRYGRTLAYVWRELPDGTLALFNLEAVEQGFAEERQYGSVPYAWRDVLRPAAKTARDARLGLWGAC